MTSFIRLIFIGLCTFSLLFLGTHHTLAANADNEAAGNYAQVETNYPNLQNLFPWCSSEMTAAQGEVNYNNSPDIIAVCGNSIVWLEYNEQTSAPEIKASFSIPTSESLYNPVLSDLVDENDDYSQQLIVLGDHSVYAVDLLQSQVLWQYTSSDIRSPAPRMIQVALGNVDLDLSIKEVVLKAYEDILVIDGQTGLLQWKDELNPLLDETDTTDTYLFRAELADMTGDGINEIIVNHIVEIIVYQYQNQNPNIFERIYYWETPNGSEPDGTIWRWFILTPPAVADLVNDSTPEIVFGLTRVIAVPINDGNGGNGNVFPRASGDPGVIPGVVVGGGAGEEIDGDVNAEDIVNLDNMHYHGYYAMQTYKQTAREKLHGDLVGYWYSETSLYPNGTPSVGRLMNSSEFHIIGGDKDRFSIIGNSYIFDSRNGNILWLYAHSSEPTAVNQYSRALSDLDNDGDTEIIISHQANSQGSVFDPSKPVENNPVWSMLNGSLVGIDPFVGNIDSDNLNNIHFVYNNGASHSISCIAANLSSVHKGEITWKTHQAVDGRPGLFTNDTDHFIRGDANTDGEINLTDMVQISNIVTHVSGGNCLNSADANNDGRITIEDAVALGLYLFLSGPQPPAPFNACGSDTGFKNLGCQSYPIEYCS